MKYLINLFPEREKNVSEKIIYFGFHYLRYILVITQFVAICVFFFRFKVDQEIVDLKDKLYQKQSIVTATSDLVSRVGEIDLKMGQIRTIIRDQDVFSARYSYVVSKISPPITVDKMSISADEIDINGTSLTIEPVKTLYELLIAEKRFGIVDLSNIQKSTDSFIFTLHLAEFKP